MKRVTGVRVEQGVRNIEEKMGIDYQDAIPAAQGGRVLVLFDGHCALCNGAVRWLLRRDRRDRLRFAPLECFPELARKAGETIVAVGPGGEVMTHSTAVLAAMRVLPQPWRVVAELFGFVPRVLRDSIYGFVARNRFRLRKRLAACPVPGEAERGHFYTAEGWVSSVSGYPPGR